MNFQRREESLELGGQTVTLRELSAAEFSEVSKLDDDNQFIQMLYLSLSDKPDSPQDILGWPNSIVNELSSLVMSLNGLTDQGN